LDHVSRLDIAAAPRKEYKNNTWFLHRESNRVMVFVHGALSSADASWRDPETDTFWPELILNDHAFDHCSIFLAGYESDFKSKDYTIGDVAKEILQGFTLPTDGHAAVLDYDQLIFVCHSRGGIVVRYMLERYSEMFSSKCVGLLLIASPSGGSRVADLLLGGHKAGGQLGWQSPDLVDLDDRFRSLLKRKAIPNLYGQEAFESRPFRIFGVTLLWRVVEPESAHKYFDDHRQIPRTDHSSIVKPTSEEHPSHRLLREFYQRFDSRFKQTLPPVERPSPADQVFCCKRWYWFVRINDDGDAQNEMFLGGITRAMLNGRNAYRMRRPWTQSGKNSRYYLSREGSSVRVSLAMKADQPVYIEFERPPSDEDPAKVVLEHYDFNVYSMDIEEFGRKRNARTDGIDFVEKRIGSVDIGELFLVVRFPPSMRLASGVRVFAEAFVLPPESSDEGVEPLPNLPLTRQIESEFHYAECGRVALLRVSNPKPWTAYRISWRLGPSDHLPPTAMQGLDLELGRAEMRRIRDWFCRSDLRKSEAEAKEAVLRHLAQFTLKLITLLGYNPDHPGWLVRRLAVELELTLMGVHLRNGHEEILQVVAGTRSDVWDLEMEMGDGIAGLAAKRLQPRIHDHREAAGSPFEDRYIPLDGRHHEWLMCLPIFDPVCGKPYGVWNVGTFDPELAAVLRLANRPDLLNTLMEYTNGEFFATIRKLVKFVQDADGPQRGPTP
jgi:pimeloyl-ACP methyl ester carboxylesterase